MVGNTKSISKIVVDASATLAFLLPDEKKDKVNRLFIDFRNKKIEIVVPLIFYFEVLNGLKTSVLRKRISPKLANKLVEKFLQMRIKTGEVNWQETFKLALKKKLSFYDASYLALAKAEKIPLLTLDRLLEKS